MNERELAKALAEGYHKGQINALRGVRKDKRRTVQRPKGLDSKQYNTSKQEV